MSTNNKEKQKDYSRKHYELHPERKKQLQEYNKKYRDRNYKFIRRHKKLCGCSYCGYNKSEHALDYHHIDVKLHNVSTLARKSSLKKLKTEIKKCIVLCANCHRELTFTTPL